MCPAASRKPPVGLLRLAAKAGPPSPTPPFGAPLPATVLTRLQPTGGPVRTPVDVVVEQLATVHFRMRLLPASAMYKLAPAESIAKPLGWFNCARDASTLSAVPDVPKPTTVVIIPVLR